MPIDIVGDQSVRSFSDILKAFDLGMVQWLFTLMVAQFATGVALAFRDNKFDWAETLDVGKKLVIYMFAWGGAFILGETAGKAVYALILTALTGGIVANVTALMGMDVKGILGQLVTKGPGDGKDTSVKPPEEPPLV